LAEVGGAQHPAALRAVGDGYAGHLDWDMVR
jgi:hypothetical protein